MQHRQVAPGQIPAQPSYHQKLKEGQFSISGQVVECLPNTMFQVEVSAGDIPQLIGTKLLCTLAGKMRLNRIRVLPGDKVIGYVTKYDLTHGKITFRTK
ncbi:MAG: translation initiation factor IF-1 [Patescibacteria group bacterium]